MDKDRAGRYQMSAALIPTVLVLFAEALHRNLCRSVQEAPDNRVESMGAGAK